MRRDRLPLTYDECRARFRHPAHAADLLVDGHKVAARGPHGQALTVDVTSCGSAHPDRALLVVCGVHGVEGFVTSGMVTELLDRIVGRAWPTGFALLLVHAVNPWGMAWGRRQNESNVDLNRNWRRDHRTPPPNPAYDDLHPLACPDSRGLPSIESTLEHAAAAWAFRCCFTPDDPVWEARALDLGAVALDRALTTVLDWR